MLVYEPKNDSSSRTMKKTSLFLSLLALSVSMAQAAPVYTITLTSAERFTDCSVIYKSGDTTKFRGKNKAGKTITKEVPNSSIIMMRVSEQAEPEKPAATPAPVTEPAPAPTAPAAEAAPSEPATPPAPEEKAETKPTTPAEPQVAIRSDHNAAKDATLRLRGKLAAIDTELAKITKPSRALISQTTNVKRQVTRQLEKMDKSALEVAKLQEDFIRAGAADFTFDKVSNEDRDRYQRDGEAAYKAMRIDMKEKKGRRKVGGLDKFEIMRDRYQGIPEYKQAYAWYIKTLHDLQKKWTRMHDKEFAARKRLIPDKRSAMEILDKRQYEKLAAKLKEEGDDIAEVWVVPPPRNLKVLSMCVNKVKSAIRRNEGQELHEAVGTVPSLLQQYWANMDEVRMAMVTGDLEGASKKLENNAAYKIIVALNQNLLPSEYREPIKDQHRDTQKEITKRLREYRILKSKLERETAILDRETANAEAQIENAMSAIQKEQDLDTGENTMELEQEPAASDSEQPAKETAPATAG